VKDGLRLGKIKFRDSNKERQRQGKETIEAERTSEVREGILKKEMPIHPYQRRKIEGF